MRVTAGISGSGWKGGWIGERFAFAQKCIRPRVPERSCRNRTANKFFIYASPCLFYRLRPRRSSFPASVALFTLCCSPRETWQPPPDLAAGSAIVNGLTLAWSARQRIQCWHVVLFFFSLSHHRRRPRRGLRYQPFCAGFSPSRPQVQTPAAYFAHRGHGSSRRRLQAH